MIISEKEKLHHYNEKFKYIYKIRLYVNLLDYIYLEISFLHPLDPVPNQHKEIGK